MIPKMIHYCWFGNNELPLNVQKCIKSWEKYCPGYQIIRWDESNYDCKKNRYMKEAYENKKWGFVSDYARFDILYHYGGIYFDTDVELIRSFDDLLANDCFMGFENHYVAPGLVVAARKGVPEIKEMMSLYDDLKFCLDDGSLNLVPIPRYITNFLVKKGLKQNGEKQRIGNITIYPSEYFCPKDMMTGEYHITANTYSIHHFDASWWGEKEKRDFEKHVRLIGRNLWLGRIVNGFRVWKEEGLKSLMRKVITLGKEMNKNG